MSGNYALTIPQDCYNTKISLRIAMKPATDFLARCKARWNGGLAGLWLGAAVFLVCDARAAELRTVEAVREMSIEQAGQKIPVRLRGVITFFDQQLYSYFLQDDTAGIYLDFPTNVAPPPLAPGQEVEVIGVTSPGEYAPVVAVSSVIPMGTAALPEAKPVTYEQLANGAEDSQFIQVRGVVRSAQLMEDRQHYLVEMVVGTGRLLVYTSELPVKKPTELLDSTVRVRGVCATKFTHNRQLFAIRLMVPRPQDLVIEAPSPEDPFAIPAMPIGGLLQFASGQSYGHRVKVRGTVTYYVPGEEIFIEDEGRGVDVQTRERDPLLLGDRVEVLSFVSQGEYTPVLQDAVYRKISFGEPLDPVILTPEEALKGNYDCCLIQVTARVLNRTQDGLERYLILQEGSFIFHAYLKNAVAQDAFAGLEIGSRVTVTGICQIDPGDWEAGESWHAKAFNIKLRSYSDVAVLTAPPWWTLKRVIWGAAAMGLAALMALAWVGVLHRQVKERTQQLEGQIQERQRAERRREIEQERARVAQDLHDDLGAGLTEVNILSSLVKSPTTSADEKERYLDTLSETARRMVTSLDEIVWTVNSHNDTLASLASYFGSYTQRLLDLAGVSCGLDIATDFPNHPLDPKFRQQIFFAFKEALTNVVRHAQAQQVWLRISVRDHLLVVEVADDGRGLDSAERQAGSDGLANMTERLKKLGGECRVTSNAHSGTVVRFIAPLPDGLS
jgi:signal transduction histidine kinase